ncbi:hypothetical protein [Inquilinus sp. CAU 1745]|uniref:hypothetical protein n=1 Tax=Inquilinus sp. CAU 1745 TaxID=3140369 RepID=UPI00325A9CF5
MPAPDPASIRRPVFSAGEAAAAHGFPNKSGMSNKNNVMLDLIQHPCGVDEGQDRASSSPPVKLATTHGFRIKSGMTN